MKKFLVGLIAIVLAVATVFASEQPTKQRIDDPVLYWFDGTVFMGTGTISEKEEICNANTQNVCLDGFEEAPGEQRPLGTPYHTLYRVQ